MKNPDDLAIRWARQWQNPDLREARLLNEGVWPVSLAIARPSASEVSTNWEEAAATLDLWRNIRIGTVRWESVPYRATGGPIGIPVSWEISHPDEWAAAAGDPGIRGEYATLRRILDGTDSLFHSAIIRERSLWRSKTAEEIILTSQLCMRLSPGCAEGKPLRALSLAGIDSKFFERHRPLILRFLDLRFDGEVSRLGLETFLNAWRETDHWLLLADLGQPGLLPFPQLRVRASDLAVSGPPARALLIVENENCLHLLPQDIPGMIAVLGSGNNLAWLRGPWIHHISVAYWGDIDTWGLTLLSRARDFAPDLVPILMTRDIFDAHAEAAVVEKTPASAKAPDNLTAAEKSLYAHLLSHPRGRLEQEFILRNFAHSAIRRWAENFSR